jgi:hypothetical protein
MEPAEHPDMVVEFNCNVCVYGVLAVLPVVVVEKV